MAEPWLKEPDNKVFEYRGYKCEIKRIGEMGHLCGYVDIPEGHPLYGMEYEDINLSVHGGLTYGEKSPVGTWKIGFDCAHEGDLVPRMYNLFGEVGIEHYWTMDEVTAEIESMVDQIIERVDSKDGESSED